MQWNFDIAENCSTRTYAQSLVINDSFFFIIIFAIPVTGREGP
jgi:hypothetical protein